MSSTSKPVVIMDNTSSEPFITTVEEMAAAIPDLGPLVRACSGCGRSPAEGANAFAKCGKCGTSHYCSRECQVAHWKEHKPMCKQRVDAMAQLAEQREAARLAGKKFFTPFTIQTWYRNESSAIEHAAFHVLELYKGTKASLQPTHIALFTVRVDEAAPEDAALVRLEDVLPAPFAAFSKSIGTSGPMMDMCRKAARSGQMTLFFLDVKQSLQLIEFHAAPPSEPYTSGQKTPDKYWRVHVRFKLNGGLSGSTA
ncbi:hypothetical protein FB451DRAFT_1397282 [Mycena latifolia]|nr:hypothetical protein FB451DRAFT_1397282 [Mycena latifolia]